jgi:hypothetical protein
MPLAFDVLAFICASRYVAMIILQMEVSILSRAPRREPEALETTHGEPKTVDCPVSPIRTGGEAALWNLGNVNTLDRLVGKARNRTYRKLGLSDI